MSGLSDLIDSAGAVDSGGLNYIAIMCSPYDAQPPDLPEGAERPTGERLLLTSADGTDFAAYQASAPTPSGSAAVVLPDVRGLFSFYERLAENLAACGVDAIATDYFGRTAGTELPRPADFDFMAHVGQTTPENIRDDVAAALARLRETTDTARMYSVGFCFGGANSFNLAWRGLAMAGVVGFYGRPRDPRPGHPSAMDHVEGFACPVLGLFGGADRGIPVADVGEFDEALTRAGVGHEIEIYQGAPHSFFDRSFDEHREACEDAWRRMLTFMNAR
jgi:carboxymethylenebutenolidase